MLERSNVALTKEECSSLRSQIKAISETYINRTMFVGFPKQLFACSHESGSYVLRDASGVEVFRDKMPLSIIRYLRTRPGISAIGFEDEVGAAASAAARAVASVPRVAVASVDSVPKAVASAPKANANKTSPMSSVRNHTEKTVAIAKKKTVAKPSMRTTRSSKLSATVPTVKKTHRRKSVPLRAPFE